MAVRKAGADRVFWGSLLAALALTAPCCFDAIVETEIGARVVIGRDVLRGRLPETNGHSWIAMDQPWVPTGWLFDVLSAALEERLGPLGLQLMTLCMGAASLVLLGKLLSRGGHFGPLLLPALAVLLEPRLRPNPRCMAWIAVMAVLLACLAARERGARWRWLALAFVILGVNLHAGAIFAAALLALFFLEAWWRRRRWDDLVGCLAAPAAALCAPGTFRNYGELEGRLGPDGIVPFAGAVWPQALLVVAPLLGRAIDLLAVRARRRTAALTGVAALGLAALQSDYATRLATLDLSPKFDPTVLPVRAARYVEDHHLDGRHFNSVEDGGYLMYALPGLPVFIDGRRRAYPASLEQALQQTERSPAGFDLLLRSWGVEWAVTQRREANGLLESRPGWALVYWDDLNEIFVRRDVQRWERLVASDELRFLSPSGVRQGPPEAIRAEVDRLLVYSPRDPLLLSARALAGPPLESPDARQ